MESKVVVPAQGKKITLQNGKLNVPENPIIPYIEGDGIGVDVTPAMLKVVDAAVEKAYAKRGAVDIVIVLLSIIYSCL